MTKRFSQFIALEKSLIMLGLCKIRLPDNEVETRKALSNLLDEVSG